MRLLDVHTCVGDYSHDTAVVIRSAAGGFAVVAVMLQPPSSSSAAQPNPCLAAALAHVPDTPQAEAGCPSSVDPQQLLPAGAAAARFVHYSGSLTTPPCSEQVDWLVWEQPLPVTDKQVSAGTCSSRNAEQHTLVASGNVASSRQACTGQLLFNDVTLGYAHAHSFYLPA
jgi:carbonic anhydrase